MRLRSFNAPDMHDAMKMVRETMGEDAVIISTTRDPLGQGVCITVAMEVEDEEMEFALLDPATAAAPFRSPIASYARRTYDQTLQEIEKILRFHNTPDYLTTKLMEIGRYLQSEQEFPSDNVKHTLTRILDAAFSYQALPLDTEGWRIMLIGAPGVGKTMTIVKMASQIVMNRHKVIVVTTDNKRAGGVEQLSAFTSILGLELKVASNRAELWNILQECPPTSRVLIDSAGTNPYNFEDIKEIKQLSELDMIEPVLVSATGTDPSEVEDMAQSFSYLGIRRMLITRADTARRFGSVLAMADVGNLSFCNLSSTARVVGEFKTIDAVFLTNLLMQYRLETSV